MLLLNTVLKWSKLGLEKGDEKVSSNAVKQSELGTTSRDICQEYREWR